MFTAPTAILSALAEEQRGLIEQLAEPHQVQHAGRTFWCGSLQGQPVVLALSRIGKVAAATTAAALIERFAVARVVFTGVAGGVADGVCVGDVVVATGFVQHDLDVSPLYPKYEVPLYGQSQFAGHPALSDLLHQAAVRALSEPADESTDTTGQHLDAEDPWSFPAAQVHLGLLASGDRFVSGAQEVGALFAALQAGGHDVLAVEMECAAVAQVCFDYGVPFAAVRTISDRADDTAHLDFNRFVEQVASRYAQQVVGHFLKLL